MSGSWAVAQGSLSLDLLRDGGSTQERSLPKLQRMEGNTGCCVCDQTGMRARVTDLLRCACDGVGSAGTGDPRPLNGNSGALILKSGRVLHQNQVKYQTREEIVTGICCSGETAAPVGLLTPGTSHLRCSQGIPQAPEVAGSRGHQRPPGHQSGDDQLPNGPGAHGHCELIAVRDAGFLELGLKEFLQHFLSSAGLYRYSVQTWGGVCVFYPKFGYIFLLQYACHGLCLSLCSERHIPLAYSVHSPHLCSKRDSCTRATLMTRLLTDLCTEDT